MRTFNFSRAKLIVSVMAVTCLAVNARPDEPASQPAQASSLKAFYHSGQTFITWQEVGEPTVRYRIYRSTSPIKTPDALTADQRVGEVSAGTSLNISASIDLFTVLPAMRKNRNSKYEIPKRVHYVIDEKAGPLSPTTGVFVYTVKTDEPAYYAVTAVKDGTETTNLVAGAQGNALSAPVQEKVAFPGAALQSRTDGYQDYVHWTDDVGTKEYPSMGSLPSTPYNFRVFVPKAKGPLPLILFLHGSAMQFNRPKAIYGEDEKRSLYITLDSPTMPTGIKDAPNNPYPFSQGWYGHNENAGTAKPESEGQVQPYAVRRVVWMIDWAKHNYEIDSQRVAMRGSSMGALGVMQIAMLHPDRFAAIMAQVPPLGGGRRSSSTSASAPASRDTKIGTGRSASEGRDEDSLVSLSRDPIAFAAAHPEVELPYIAVLAGRTDNVAGFKTKPSAVKRLAEMHLGVALYWDLRAHQGTNFAGTPPAGLKLPVFWNRPGGQPTVPLDSFAINQSYLAVANLSIDDDPGTVNYDVKEDQRPPWDAPGAGDFVGTFGGKATWDRDSIVDEADRYDVTMKLLPFAKQDEATADITPRRLQQFKPAPGSTVHYTITAVGEDKPLVSGELTANDYGRVTIEKAPITKAGTRLVLHK